MSNMQVVVNIADMILVARGVVKDQEWLPGGDIDVVFTHHFDEGTGDRQHITFGTSEISHVIDLFGAPYEAIHDQRHPGTEYDVWQEWFDFIDEHYKDDEDLRLESSHIMCEIKQMVKQVEEEFIRTR